MTLNRWKVLACALTIGVGGLAVFATPPASNKSDAPKEPAPLPPLTVKSPSPANGDDTPVPLVPKKTDEPAKPTKSEDLDFVIPLPPAPPSKTEVEEKKAATEPVFEPVAPPAPPLILPVKGESDVKPGNKNSTEADTLPPVITPPSAAKPEFKDPPLVPATEPKAPNPPKAPTIDFEAPLRPASDKDPLPPPTKPAPPPPLLLDPPSNIAPPSVAPPLSPPDTSKTPATLSPIAPSPAPAKASDSAKLKMLLRMGDGQPRFEIRNSTTTELLLKVYGEKIEMQAPPESRSSLAGVTAIGRVRFAAPGIEGTCDHLTILSATGEVLLKGNIHLKAKHGKSWSEMTAEKMVYQVGSAGLTSTTPSRPPVRPASYIPD